MTNTGPVIPPTEIDHLFQPFQHLDPRRIHHDNSDGLGLSIVRAIAASHGATIDAHPKRDGGLTITVTFPSVENAATPSAVSEESGTSRLPIETGADTSPFRGSVT